MKAGGEFSIEEVCAIIKSCRESGVGRLQIGTFAVSFLPEPEKPAAVTPEQIELAKKYEAEAFKDHERRIREEELSHLRISDPEAYEELVNRGELEHAGEESDGVNP
jgi:hypothetical protein